MTTVAEAVEARIRAFPRGEWIGTPADLTDCGKRRAVDEALAELARAGAIRRIGRDLYDRPVFSEFLGRVVPANLDLIVRAIERRDGVRLFDAGAICANALLPFPHLRSGRPRERTLAGRTSACAAPSNVTSTYVSTVGLTACTAVNSGARMVRLPCSRSHPHRAWTRRTRWHRLSLSASTPAAIDPRARPRPVVCPGGTDIMEGTYTTHIRFHVRTISLQQLAGLWSTVMALVPEVHGRSATFERCGQPTEHEYHYRDADELAHAGLEVRPGELRLRSIRVYGPGTSVAIHERPGADFLSVALVLPNALWLDITGSNERDVLTIRNAVEHWAARNLATSRRALWLKLGALAAGIGAAWLGAAVMGLSANQAIAATVLWVFGFLVVSMLQSGIPAVRRRTIDLRIVNDAPPGGGGRRGGATIDPDPDAGATMDAGTSVAREGA